MDGGGGGDEGYERDAPLNPSSGLELRVGRKYRLGKKIGSGSFGGAWRARVPVTRGRGGRAGTRRAAGARARARRPAAAAARTADTAHPTRRPRPQTSTSARM